jgi:predicted PurR-regulated permease PerM
MSIRPNEVPMNQSNDNVWTLTNEWMAKIEKAYNDYVATIYRMTWITLASGLALVIALTCLFLFTSLTKNMPSDSILRTEAAAIIATLLAISIVVVVAIVLARRIQQAQTLRRELADLLNIAEELFQMVISSEENNATGNRYEYLVNHVRILEVKHLLKKVERVIGRSH